MSCGFRSCLITAAVLLILAACNTFAERLPFKTYSTADGLPSDSVNKMFLDSHGFLWFCTEEGISRFDGYRFKNFTQEHGLPHRNINDIVENADGTFIVATSNGVAVFDPRGRAFRWDMLEGKLERNSEETPLFQTYLPETGLETNRNVSVLSLARRPSGEVLVGMRSGLFQMAHAGDSWTLQPVESATLANQTVVINALLTDARGNVWIAGDVGLYILTRDSNVEKLSNSGSNSLFEDRSGRVWVDSGGLDLGIRLFEYDSEGRPTIIATYTTADGLPANGFTNAVAQTEDGRIFVTSNAKLLEYKENAQSSETRFRLIENEAAGAVADRSGNIWFRTHGRGVEKYTPNSFRIYDQRDGLSKNFVSSIFIGRDGRPYFTVGNNELFGFADGKIHGIVPNSLVGRMWGDNYLDLQASDSSWWIPGTTGLYHYPRVDDFRKLAATPPQKIYKKVDGLNSDPVFLSYEDSRGDIWLTTLEGKNSLVRWEKSTDTIYKYTTENGIPGDSGASAIGEDRNGNIWIAFFFGQLLRYKDGKFRSFTDEKLIPLGRIARIYSDNKGRIWLATVSRGLFRVDDPDAETPVFQNISTKDGLSSTQASCITQDKLGRFYIGTGRGIDRMDPETGRIRTFTKADGLPFNSISYCKTDDSGTLWFATNNSIVEMKPKPAEQSVAPQVMIDELSVNGAVRNISDTGETSITGLEFSPNERQIRIGFLAISLASGESLKYQYKLGDQPWSLPTAERSVAFELAPGSYNFAVKAINAEGVESPTSATVSFKILPPVWQRWWFVGLLMLFAGGAVFALDRYRVAKTRQIESALALSRESESRFRTLADTASDAIITIDEDSKIVFVNGAIEKVFGYAPDELIGQQMPMLMPERMRSGHHDGLARYISTSKRNIDWTGVALPGLHKDGREIPLEVSFGEFEREGQRFFTGIARDVSERHRAERALQEAREERFRELQRVRTRIASDLHDDIGSSLTQIAVLSEVARGQSANSDGQEPNTPLDRIKTVSKELVAVMSDIVWAINPQKDYLHDLVLRMRRFGSDLFTARGISFDLRAPEIDDELQLGANIRREAFAIFKEAANNSAKYSECKNVHSEFKIENDWLILKFEDDGIGFDTGRVLSSDFRPEMGGNGIVSMQKRAAELGGRCEFQSTSGSGTTVLLMIPLRQPAETGGHSNGSHQPT